MPGKKKRAMLREKKMAARKSSKAARNARYKAMAESGDNQKRKRKGFTVAGAFNKYDHPDGHCGNIGCRKCFPDMGVLADRRLRRWKFPIELQRRFV